MAMQQGARPYDWALEFDSHIKSALDARDFRALTDIGALDQLTRMAHPSLEHYLPLLYTAGAGDDKEKLSFFNESFDLASISMRSFVLS